MNMRYNFLKFGEKSEQKTLWSNIENEHRTPNNMKCSYFMEKSGSNFLIFFNLFFDIFDFRKHT